MIEVLALALETEAAKRFLLTFLLTRLLMEDILLELKLMDWKRRKLISSHHQPNNNKMSMSSTLSSRVESLNLDQSQTLKSNNNSTSTSIQPLEPRSTRAPVSPSIKLSKALSYLLRHGATKEKINIRQDGFVKVDEILKSNRVKGIEIPLDNQNQEEPTLTPTNTDSTKPLKKPKAKKNARSPNVEDIRKVVDENEKKRFEILEEEEKEEERRNGIPKGKGKEKGNSTLWIRAVQGHSLKEVSRGFNGVLLSVRRRGSVELKEESGRTAALMLLHSTTFKRRLVLRLSSRSLEK